MLRTIGLKLVRLVPVLFIVSAATSLLIELVPGDPILVIIGAEGDIEDYERIEAELGLNRNVASRYIDWLGDIFTGDFGEQITRPGVKVADRLKQTFPVTIQISLMGMAMALLISVPMGSWAAYRAGSRFDRYSSGAAFGIISIPSFLAGLLLIFMFVFHSTVPRYAVLILGLAWSLWLLWSAARARREGAGGMLLRLAATIVVAGLTVWLANKWPSFPRQGFVRWTSEEGRLENLRSSLLPAITVGLTEIAVFMRLLRGDMQSTLQEDFILSARAKGMPPVRILARDALRPSSFSLITLAGVAFGRLIGGTVIVETIFRLPGMGSLIVNDGVNVGDFPVVQGGVLILATFYVVLNGAIDISYSYLDPRLRRGR
ncbi:MAG: ABC transporter permease [bacterium]|nr:ABC transporter permease [bacterium]